VQDIVYRTSRCPGSTTDQSALFRAVPGACANGSTGARSNRATKHRGASRQAEHANRYYGRRYNVFEPSSCVHFLASFLFLCDR
jgi:hypothetical protein